MVDSYLSKMKELGADGIDFIPISSVLAEKKYQLCEVIASYTKEDWIKGVGSIPKTPYLFWKIVEGGKEYLR